jgi:hypothetical protein
MTSIAVDAILLLLNAEVITDKEASRLTKKVDRLEAQRVKAASQTSSNHFVEEHILTLTVGDLFKHRSVWEAVGVESFTRSEVLESLQFFKEKGLVAQRRTGPNNFQVFWTRILSDEVGS